VTPSFPLIRGGLGQVLFPSVRKIRFQTSLQVMANGQEQRAAGRGVPLFEFELNYNSLTLPERNQITSFFDTVIAQVSLWNISFGAQLYDNLKFTQDNIAWTEKEPNLYNTTLNARQVANPGYPMPNPASIGQVFPSLSTQAMGKAFVQTQRPYGTDWRQLTTVNDNPTGWAYPYYWYGSNLGGANSVSGNGLFPPSARKRWRLQYILQDTDTVQLATFFIGMLGMWGQFNFFDPEDGTQHYPCRFESDVLELNHQGPNLTTTSVSIIECPGI